AVSVTTDGSDVAGLMAWSLGATYGFDRGDVSFSAAYALYQFWPALSVSAGRGFGRGGGLVLDGTPVAYAAETWGASANADLPVLRLPELPSELTFSYDVSWLRDVSPLPPPDPNAPIPRLPDTGVGAGFSARWSLSNVRGFGFTLGPVQGRNIALATRIETPALGSRRHSIQATWEWDEFFRMPADPALSLRYLGGIGQADGGGNFFGLGGKPRQDIIDAVLNSTRVASAWLRGYAPGAVAGTQFHLLNIEYRVPIHILEQGLSTLPFYFRRLHVAALVDAGAATRGAPGPSDARIAVGASLRLDMNFGYYMAGTFDIGYARGLSTGGQNEVWLLLTNGI